MSAFVTIMLLFKTKTMKGIKMKKITTLVAFAMLLVGATATADDYREVWECEAKDGKTLEDIQAINSKWQAWMRKNVDKDISSAVLTAVVGDITGFLFVDTYPSLEVWGKGKAAADDNEEMDALNEEFDATAECEETRLWRYRPTP